VKLDYTSKHVLNTDVTLYTVHLASTSDMPA
jgi:hypothetical protein